LIALRALSSTVIALITAGGCDINMDGEYPIDLSEFSALRDISLTGPQRLKIFMLSARLRRIKQCTS
jgi:hypothetical protein